MFETQYETVWASQVTLEVKSPPTNAEGLRDTEWIPGLGPWVGGEPLE